MSVLKLLAVRLAVVWAGCASFTVGLRIGYAITGNWWWLS